MVPVLYSEVNLLCIILLVIILIRVWRGTDRQNSQRLFMLVLVGNIVMYVLDSVWALGNYGVYRLPQIPNFVLNAFYYAQTGVSIYLWFLYAECVMDTYIIRNRKARLLSMLPILILIACAISSYRTHWLFYIDDQNVYHRGHYYFIQLIVVYGYIVVTAVRAIHMSLQKRNYIRRKEFRSLAAFGVLPFVFGVLQVVTDGVPLSCVGITASLLWVYLAFQDQRVSIDPLTRLNNRNQMERYINDLVSHNDKMENLYLLMMDLDYFKKINDQMGHVQGDQALYEVAESLKKTCGNNFIGRYGGDEFIVVCKDMDKNEVKKLCEQINHQLEKISACKKCQIPLHLSIGYAKYSDTMQTIQDWVAAADKELYRIKKARKHV